MMESSSLFNGHRDVSCYVSMAFFAILLAAAFVPTSAAQNVPSKGQPATLEVATWNMLFFGSGDIDEAQQFENARAVFEQSEIDVWGVQEIRDKSDFNRLIDSLGTGYEGALATDNDFLRLGFIWRTDVVETASVEHILTDSRRAFGNRAPLKLEADVALPDTSLTVTFITLHAKASDGQENHMRRSDAADALKSRLDFGSLAGKPVVVLGDYNDEVDGSVHVGGDSPYADFRTDDEDYRFVSLPIEQNDLGTFCGDSDDCDFGRGNNRTYDHILITNELFSAYVDDSAMRYAALLDAFDGMGGDCDGEYVCTTSDHLPVFARFDFAGGTPVAPADVLAEARVEAPFPNPARARSTLRYTLRRSGAVTAALYDALGRRIRTLASGRQAAGEHALSVPVEGLPAGAYFVRLRVPGGRAVVPVTVGR